MVKSIFVLLLTQN